MCIRDSDIGATVSIVRPDVVKDLKPICCSCSLRTGTGQPVKVFGKVEIHLRLGRLEFSHQVLVADIVDEAIFGVDVMNAYRFIVDFKNNVLRIGGEEVMPVSYTHLQHQLQLQL